MSTLLPFCAFRDTLVSIQNRPHTIGWSLWRQNALLAPKGIICSGLIAKLLYASAVVPAQLKSVWCLCRFAVGGRISPVTQKNRKKQTPQPPDKPVSKRLQRGFFKQLAGQLHHELSVNG